MQFTHVPVLLQECMHALHIRPNGIYVDGTCGGAGHSAEIAKHLTGGRLISIDQDPDAVTIARQRLAPYPCASVVQANFSEIERVLAELQIPQVDGILLDLGVSSYQLDTPERGFSYHNNAPLDMRMSRQGISAKDIVNTYSSQQLEQILREYGEEKFSYKISQAIVRRREEKEIETTLELADIISSAIPVKAARTDTKHPARRSFQAIRIAVNRELDVLSETLDSGFELLAQKGRFCVITFHSLEDRLVKQRFASWAKGCTCPPDFPVCICGKKPRAALTPRKPVLPTPQECEGNARSRSAKLRTAEKL